jgi:hypothetical protein
LSGDDLNPNKISEWLGCEPKRRKSKGELTESRADAWQFKSLAEAAEAISNNIEISPGEFVK